MEYEQRCRFLDMVRQKRTREEISRAFDIGSGDIRRLLDQEREYQEKNERERKKWIITDNDHCGIVG